MNHLLFNYDLEYWKSFSATIGQNEAISKELVSKESNKNNEINESNIMQFWNPGKEVQKSIIIQSR